MCKQQRNYIIPKGSAYILPNGEYLHLNCTHMEFESKYDYIIDEYIAINDGLYEDVVRVEIYKEPTYEQYNSLLKWLDYIWDQKHNNINIACHYNNSKGIVFQDYKIKNYLTDTIIQYIKKFFNIGRLDA